MPKAESTANASSPSGLHVFITREPFSDFFVIRLDNGHTEELEVEDTRQWFKDRGANMDKVEKVLDQVWNFQRAEVFFDTYKEPSLPSIPHAPKL